MIRNDFTGTAWVFTSRHGCSSVTWSFSAVVNTADSTILLCLSRPCAISSSACSHARSASRLVLNVPAERLRPRRSR